MQQPLPLLLLQVQSLLMQVLMLLHYLLLKPVHMQQLVLMVDLKYMFSDSSQTQV